mmetsp:Transcript_12580/g.17487  ORF Transcript_12580/g.17487 Transcript_12580/m.17487 type:complete len:150 (+) Transcript_12580:119-568(+)
MEFLTSIESWTCCPSLSKFASLALNEVSIYLIFAVAFSVLLYFTSVLLDNIGQHDAHQLKVVSLGIKCMGKSIEDVERTFCPFLKLFMRHDIVKSRRGFTFTGWTRISEETVFIKLVECAYDLSNDYVIESSVEIPKDCALKSIKPIGG